MSEQRLTNLSYLEELGMGDDDLLIEMVEMFLENTPVSIDQMRNHCDASNWKKLAAEAHKLKPNLSYVGLDNARDLVVDIEKTAKNDPDPSVLHDRLDRLNGICREAYKELEQQLEELKK
ncbi:MAG: Hpt domain-containing protein [Balneolaceae bacterium]|nr:Hpt domain-containing protein [Balneolaceae bacterium]